MLCVLRKLRRELVFYIDSLQQPGDRLCTDEIIGGAHYGPVLVYLSKVADSSTADGSTGWFKIFQDTWSPVRNK
jgi:cellulase